MEGYYDFFGTLCLVKPRFDGLLTITDQFKLDRPLIMESLPKDNFVFLGKNWADKKVQELAEIINDNKI